jgi:hypothetical protein
MQDPREATMKTKLPLFLLAAAAACLLAANSSVEVTGNWMGEVKDAAGGTGRIRLVLRQNGDQITGTAGPAETPNPGQIYDAKLEGTHLTFSVDDTDDNGVKLTYHLDITVSHDHMEGKAQGQSADKSWTLAISLAREK